jgi:hypothetical protein
MPTATAYPYIVKNDGAQACLGSHPRIRVACWRLRSVDVITAQEDGADTLPDDQLLERDNATKGQGSFFGREYTP